MNLKYLILLVLTSTSSISFSQSYIGISGGLYRPMSYISMPNSYIEYYSKPSNLSEQTSFYVSTHIKERLGRNISFGFNFSLNYLDIDFNAISSGKVLSSNSDIILTSYLLHTQLNLEVSIVKNIVFLNFGPEIEIPINTYKHEHIKQWNNFSGYSEYTRKAKGKIGWGPGMFLGLALEQKISENKIIFIRSQVSYSVARVYEGIRSYDLMIGVGIQFFLPNFNFGKLKKKLPDGKPYELNK